MGKKKLFNWSMGKKAQIALEFILLTSIAMLMLFPTMSLFSNFVSESSREIVEIQIRQIGKSIVENAESMYYYGNGSMILVDYKFPERVKSMEIHEFINDEEKTNYYEIAFILELPGGEVSKAYESKIPIKGKFDEDSITPGKKKFKIENIGNYINISRVDLGVD